MIPIKDVRVRTVSVLAVFLLLKHFCEGQSQEVGPPQPVMAMVGDDIVLPCQLETPVDAVSMTMEWGRPDLDPRFVYVWHDGQELLVEQNKAYKGRASLSINKLKHGDLSLTLSKVNISDNGIYRCYIPKLSEEHLVELLVGVASSPSISLSGLDRNKGLVVLKCNSTGWYPEPEVLWLDGEGNLLSAGPTETVRGPDDLYTVSSRVTVEKRHSNSFTCRVQQNHINQTRETHIHVPDDFFMAPSSCTPCIAISVLLGLMFSVAVVLWVWKWRQSKIETKKHNKKNNEEKELKKKEDLDKILPKLNEELQNKDEEQNDMTKIIEILKEVSDKLVKQKEQLTVQQQKAEKLMEENEKKVKSVEKEITEKEGDKTVNRAQGYLKLKEIIQEANWNLEERKKEHQQLNMTTENLMKRTVDELRRISEKKEQVERHIQQIKKQKEETERQREEIQRKLQSETTKLVN
ncbi:butyrophilin subfamily 2 member A1-like [Sparus aurata]|uniref:butyrophilin subfamily 2 member A1-like n=1 Tax=Sparus aurata TaxID=8175 RepID=UPI0011C1B124|nr:butyrophilin subfamily 2 member A1-like [Sparus aurata]